MSKRGPGYYRNPEQVWREWSRRQLINRDGMLCALCKEPMNGLDEVTIDHIQAKSKGGSDKLTNLRLVHPGCNQERGAGYFPNKKATG